MQGVSTSDPLAPGASAGPPRRASPSSSAGPIGSLLGTFRRKIARSLAGRGGLGTARRLIAYPLERAARALQEAAPARRRYRREERAFDHRHGVDTRRDHDPGWMARLPGANWRHGRGYAPVTFQDVTGALDALELELELPRFTFVDVGAGKGRALLLAAERPFRRVLGVEYSPRLVEIAAANLARHPGSGRGEPPTILEGDAANFDFPLEPLVVFFHHPFDEPVFRVVLENLERSLAEVPRPVVVIYVDALCGSLFDDSPWFRRRPFPPGTRFTAPTAWFEFVGGVARTRVH